MRRRAGRTVPRNGFCCTRAAASPWRAARRPTTARLPISGADPPGRTEGNDLTSMTLVTTSHDTRNGMMPDIREQIRAFSLSRAEGPDREIIQALYRIFDEHNAAFWGGQLDPVVILITPPPSARASADAAEFSGFGCRQQMRVRPNIARGICNSERPQGVREFHRMVPGHALEERLRWLSDLTLHEMIHLWLNQIEHPGRHEHQGHGAPFTAACNRIGGLLGLEPVVSRRRMKDGARVGISSAWPFYVRPGGMYGGFYGGLWERVVAEAADPPPDDAAFDGAVFLYSAWTDCRVQDGDRWAFMRRVGLAEIAVAVMPDLPPGDRLVTAGDDTANGSAVAREAVASPPTIEAEPERVEAPPPGAAAGAGLPARVA
jgi:hypothetical protein